MTQTHPDIDYSNKAILAPMVNRNLDKQLSFYPSISADAVL
jgi:hypothetical protein